MSAPSTRRDDPEKLTVCHIFSGDLWAGAEVVIFNLLSRLAEDPGLRLIALSLNEGTLTERLREAGITTHVIPEHRHTLLGILWRAAPLLRGYGVNIIHAHRYKENVLASLLATWLDVGVLVTTMHGLPEAPTSSARHARAARARTALDFFVLKKLFSAAVAVSEEMRRALVDRHGFRPDQVRVIRNGGRFPSAAMSSAPRNERFHIGTVGRLVPIKGLDLMLDVAAGLKRQGHPVRFSILGDGPMRENLIRRAADLGLGDCVEILAPRSDPFPYYQSLDVYINTSLHEGLPMSVVEAMACGKPVVSAAVGGIPEIVTHGEHGFLVQGRDPAAFVECCTQLMHDEALRKRLGERASVVAHARWSATAMADGYRQLYAECASKIRGEERPASLRGRLVRVVKGQGRRVVLRLDRRRAMAVRRQPASFIRALRRARSILVLCQGNVIRSALAGRLLSDVVEGRDVSVRSAGLYTEAGWRAHPRVIARGEALNLDLSGHRAVPVTSALVAAADVVLVMDLVQLATVTRRFFRARRRTFLLTSLAPDVPLEIPDPAGRDDATVDACLDHVERALKPIIEIMAARGTTTARS
jgi:glycosyltransferase involved in cell wall biosynthesis/protein-tyrosine-phosphatase